jgi:hypothetical protein
VSVCRSTISPSPQAPFAEKVSAAWLIDWVTACFPR